MNSKKIITDTNNEKGVITYPAHGNLYLNITNRCTAECTFCIRDLSNGVYGYNLNLSEEPSVDEIVNELEKHNLSAYREIVFTGFGEPTTRLDDLLHLISWLKKKGLYVRLDTNGHAELLYPHRDVVSELKDSGLDEVSVSMNAESEDLYNRLCRPYHKNAYSAMLEFVKKAIAADIKTRVTVVGMPEVNVEKCQQIAEQMGADFYVR
ncbi:Radical SAM domain protein [Methanosalsum zhilinae DSM 4017]|uniref:Radical SAM domain protein n=1 Tax=Methanosalsum zhilinae (strain DSM 4017 / NBRC 107636 / OCM 62 / WeN5) TaxID=679901 RepID=F7XK83_METZD|nr:TatD family nuclease-associated radical SAM protein [Methanosalsum zhilinae]AEH60548.1 Radical SAM domain protein [Methanosalsum zhilinae DSM 4017]